MAQAQALYATRAKPPAPQFLTQTEMAARLGISARTLSTWHRTGKLQGWRPAGESGRLLYDIAEFERVSGLAMGPAPDRPTDARRYATYFIQAETGQVKIGRSRCIGQRLCHIQLASPVTVRCIGYLRGDREAEMHERFAALRLHGEWFRLEPDLADFIRLEALPFKG